MAENTYQPIKPMDDLRTDYVLIALGIGAAVLALAFLLIS